MFKFFSDGSTLNTINIDEVISTYRLIDENIGTMYRNVEEIKNPPHHWGVKNIVYTFDYGTMDWVRDVYTTLTITINRVVPGKDVRGIYRLTLISDNQFNIIVDSITHIGSTATTIVNFAKDFNIIAVKILQLDQ